MTEPRINNADNDLVDFTKGIQEKAHIINNLNDEIKKLDGIFKEHEKTELTLNAEIKNLNDEIKNLNAEIKNLNEYTTSSGGSIRRKNNFLRRSIRKNKTAKYLNKIHLFVNNISKNSNEYKFSHLL